MNDKTQGPVYAHTLSGSHPSEWEPLDRHLDEVAALASKFAGAFGASEWGELLGRYHDIGKLSDAFQSYITAATSNPDDAGAMDMHPGRVDHSTYGARYVRDSIGEIEGQILAFCIAGHHAGLPDESSSDEMTQRATLRFRMDGSRYLIPEVDLPGRESHLPVPTLRLRSGTNHPFQLAFFTRMIFSCLIDADRTATESFCDRETAAARRIDRSSLVALKQRLDFSIGQKQSEAEATQVNWQRARILECCRTASKLAPGFFSLNVPTGGGKTLSSLAFALNHAAENEQRRVIVAIPFTSIIEQTADVYRAALGELADTGLVEHHTNLRPERDTRTNQLGTENWDAPLIVTTNVQLLESLFASATTPCRKIHRLAKSVIILDEAQTLPVELLRPALAALQELVSNYGCSVVLCTATQPALEYREDFDLGIKAVHHIVPDAKSLFAVMKRVEVHHVGTLLDPELADRLVEETTALCIVNTRRHAAQLFQRVAGQSEPDTCFHLSTWMCGQHRRKVLQTIRLRLKEKRPCRVISTQLIEAGVDVDFPVVFRATAGFDSIAQAAGRCNREGRLPIGHTYVFECEELPPPGPQRDAAQAGNELIGPHPDPLTPEAIEAYFRLFYWTQKERWDKHEVMQQMRLETNKRLVFQFREIAKRFKMISDDQGPILVPYDGIAHKLWEKLACGHVPYVSHRELQPYLVSVNNRMLRIMQENHLVMEHESGVWLLLNCSAYTEEKGLAPEACGLDPSLWGV